MKALYFLLSVLILPLELFTQPVIATRYQNLPYPAAGNPGFGSIRYFLEEGRLTEYLEYAEGFELSEDSIQAWACLYRSFKETGFMEAEDLGSIQYLSVQNPAQDSLYHEQIFLSIMENQTLVVHFSIFVVQFQGKITRLVLKRGEQVKNLDPGRVYSLYQEDQQKRMILLKDLPPPPMMDPKEEDRHRKAVEAFTCE